MAAEWPTREDLGYGMTVEVERDGGERLIGDVERILTEKHTHPDGIEVTLQSGATGRVRRIAPDA